MMDDETWLTASMVCEFFNAEMSESNQAAASASDFYKDYKNTPKPFFSAENQEDEPTAQQDPQEPTEPEEPANTNNDEELEILKLKLKLI